MVEEVKKDDKLSIKAVVFILIGLVIVTFGATFAFFTYTRTSEQNNKLVTGEVYMHYNEGTDQISLEKSFPESATSARERTDNKISFTIDGKNTTTNNDIYYEIMLTYGDEIDGKTRLKDDDLRFDLIETINGESETVLSGMSYSDLSIKRIWVNTIEHNTLSEVEISYELRMWVGEDVLISDTDPNADYTTDVYKNSYASVKVEIYGDFEWKAADTDQFCFTYDKNDDNTATITGYNEACDKGVIIPPMLEGYPVASIGDWALDRMDLVSVTIPETVKSIGRYAFEANLLTDVIIKGNPEFRVYGGVSGTFKDNENIKTFKYGGTCDELRQYNGIASELGIKAITSDNSSCSLLDEPR